MNEQKVERCSSAATPATEPPESGAASSEVPAFKPKCVDNTPDEPVNLGYVGGVQKPR
jgi:hypothetical protein